MNTKRILLSLVTGIMFTGSLAFADQGDDQRRARTRVRVTKPTTTTTTSVRGNTATVRTHNRVIASDRNIGVRTGTRVVTRSYPYRTYGYSGYGYGYPYYSSGPSVSFGFGYPYYSYGYGYPYGYSGYPYSNYNYGIGYYSSQPSYRAYGNTSVVIAVQTRLARAGYYRGPIDGIMGPSTSYAISVYERRHGLRADGTISGPLLRSMGLRY